MKKTRNEVAVGAFVIVALIILSLIVFFVSGVYFFRSGYAVNILYNYVSILDKGAPVRMAGVRIGEVSKVDLYYDENLKHTRVKVRLFIEKGVQIREHYKFSIQGTHILSEPHIEIQPVTGDGRIVTDGQVLEGLEPVPVEAMMDRAQHIAQNLDEMTTSLNNAFKENDTAETVKKLIVNLGDITTSMKMILDGSEGDMKQVIANLKMSSDSISAILDSVENGHGTAGGLLMKDEIYKDMRDLVADIKKHPWKLLKKEKEKKHFLFF